MALHWLCEHNLVNVADEDGDDWVTFEELYGTVVNYTKVLFDVLDMKGEGFLTTEKISQIFQSIPIQRLTTLFIEAFTFF